jgi:hypothetical protein
MEDGSNYNGEFKDNMMDGLGNIINILRKGIYIWNDKKHYTGNWRENMMHG